MMLSRKKFGVTIGFDRMNRPIRRVDPYLSVMANVKRAGDCLEYTRSKNKKGYGWIGGGFAHRAVWAHHNPANPAPPMVLHSCDNPSCVNIEHLRAGTAAENSADMVARGRTNPARGEKSGKAKLTSSQVGELRERRARGEQLAVIAKDLGIHASHACRIVNGKRRQFDGGF